MDSRTVGVGAILFTGDVPGPPKGPLIESFWPLIVGTQGMIEGSWEVLVASRV